MEMVGGWVDSSMDRSTRDRHIHIETRTLLLHTRPLLPPPPAAPAPALGLSVLLAKSALRFAEKLLLPLILAMNFVGGTSMALG